MPGVAVVTDTCHYLAPELVERHGIHQVSLYVHWNGRQDRESELGDYGAFYDHLGTASDLPTTSQPSIGDFLAVYEPLLEEGRDIVSIHLSGGISGTLTSAQQARDDLVSRGIDPERIHVLDSVTACGGQGCMVLGAAVAAGRGEDAAAVAAAARETREHLKIWFCVDTLEFLKRGGRIGAARAWIGTTLRIKPILTLEREITPVERVRTAGRAFERMVDYMQMRADDGADGWVVQHIRAHDKAEELVARGREIYGCEPLFVSEVGPVIGTHVGPGLIGIGGVPSRFVR